MHYQLNQLAYLATHPDVSCVSMAENKITLMMGECSMQSGTWVSYTMNTDGTITEECEESDGPVVWPNITEAVKSSIFGGDLLADIWHDTQGKICGVRWLEQ